MPGQRVAPVSRPSRDYRLFFLKPLKGAILGTLRWYKRDPRAALAGMMELTLEERGAYNCILDLIYIHDGAIDDDDRLIAAWLKVEIRVWRRIKKVLLQREKIYPHAGQLRNERADREVLTALHRVASSAKAGIASAVSRGLTPRNVNGLAPTPVQRPFEQTTSRKKESLLPYLGATVTNSDHDDQILPPESHSPPPRQNGHASPNLTAIIKAKGWTP